MRFSISSVFTKRVLAIVTSLSLYASPALAEEANGEFTLTREVHWGPNLLTAGDYEYRLEHEAAEVLFLRNLTSERNFIVLAKSVSATSGGRTDSLLLERRGNDWFVSSLTLGSLGERLYFAAPVLDAAMTGRDTSAKLTSLAKR